MKISKAYIKRVILEELSRLEEFRKTAAPAVETQPPSKEDLANDAKTMQARVKAAEAAIEAGKAAEKDLPNLKQQLQNAKNKLGGL